MNITYHYPPELFSLVVDTIPLLFKSKQDVLLFFRGAGVSDDITRDLWQKIRIDRNSITKYEITRTILSRLNEKGEAALRERREILKRITEFDSFSSCWPSDQLKAKGLVAEIRSVVNVKDSFTRMNIERKKEAERHQAEQRAKIAEMQKKKAQIAAIGADISRLFSDNNPQRRGKALEGILNRLFEVSGILIREAFSLQGSEGEGIIEQIDGVIEIDSALYLVEMKWWDKPLGKQEISEHLVRIYHRGHARGIFISASGYTEPAISLCKESLSKTTIVLCDLSEIVLIIEQERDFKSFLRSKIQASIIDKNPYAQVI